MKFVYRWLRRLMTVVFVFIAIAASGYFAYETTTGIIDEVEFRREQSERDSYRRQTATHVESTIEAESQTLITRREVNITTESIGSEGTSLTVVSTPTTPAPSPSATPESIQQISAEPATTEAPEVTPPRDASETPTMSSDSAPGEDEDSEIGVAMAATETTSATQPPTLTDTPTATVTRTTTPSPSPTEPASNTPLPSSTATPTPRPSATDTQVPTAVAQDPPTAFPTSTPLPTDLPTNTLFPTNTLTPTATMTPTHTATPTNTLTATPTATHTATSTPSNTPTFTYTPLPTLPIEGTYVTPVNTPIAQIPLRAPLVEDSDDIINIAMLGSDVGSSLARTDVIIIVSINKEVGSVAMWHIPRDMLVYIPGDTINRINLTFQIGEQNGWPGGGPALLREMFLYNFGIEIDYYARVDFDDFRTIIDELGGLTISVDCEINDWRLKEEYQDDPPAEAFLEGEENWGPYWEQHTLRIGVHELDSYMALWYARSRVTTNDLDRGRRQMDLLRAMWYQAQANGLFEEIINLWPQAVEIVDTDMDLEDALSLAPVALSLDLGNIERFSMRNGVHIESWQTPDDGRSVFLPNWPAIRALAQEFVTPPTQNRLRNDSARIEIHDGTAYGAGWGRVAADRLAWEGFSPTVTEELRSVNDVTTIYDYTGTVKGSELDRLQEILRVGDFSVVQEPNPDRRYDYLVVIGRNYNSCVYGTSADEVAVPGAPQDIGSTDN